VLIAIFASSTVYGGRNSRRHIIPHYRGGRCDTSQCRQHSEADQSQDQSVFDGGGTGLVVPDLIDRPLPAHYNIRLYVSDDLKMA
jgi:hypothetical protein